MDPLETQVSESLRRWIAPIEPPPAFVRSLRSELVDAARRQRVQGPRVRRWWLIGAAILGSVASVSGLAAFLLLRRRARIQPRPV